MRRSVPAWIPALALSAAWCPLPELRNDSSFVSAEPGLTTTAPA
jgi:hypothetical protein